MQIVLVVATWQAIGRSEGQSESPKGVALTPSLSSEIEVSSSRRRTGKNQHQQVSPAAASIRLAADETLATEACLGRPRSREARQGWNKVKLCSAAPKGFRGIMAGI